MQNATPVSRVLLLFVCVFFTKTSVISAQDMSISRGRDVAGQDHPCRLRFYLSPVPTPARQKRCGGWRPPVVGSYVISARHTGRGRGRGGTEAVD